MRSDEPERIEADVDADGRGYLVIADSIVRAGWSASVDGKDVTMVPGNHAFAAIPVGSGEHRVVVEYRAPGFALGKLVTAVSVLLSVALMLWPWWARRRRGARPDPEDELP